MQALRRVDMQRHGKVAFQYGESEQTIQLVILPASDPAATMKRKRFGSIH